MAKGDTQPNPFRLALDTQRKLLDAATEGVEKARIAGDRMETIENVNVGQTPSEVVYTENKLELLHYEPQTDEQHDVPIIITYALINRPYILDLQPDRSVVRRLLEAGHDVYLIDWNEPSRLDQHLTLADYVNRYMDNCVDVVRERSGQDSINLLGYCMGGTMSVMYTALHQEKVRTLGLMAAGLCFDNTGGVLELWGDEDYYDPEEVTEAFGNMPAEILEVGFALMDPVANYVSKYARLYDNLENEDFVENFARMEMWLSEGIDVAGDAYVEFLRDIYQGNRLYNNEYYLDGEHVDVSSIEVPMLQIMGKYDHLIPTEASKPFNDVVGSDDVETIEYPTGHIGLAVSGSSHREVWPRVAQWYLKQSADRDDLREVAAAVADETGATVDVDVTEGDYGEAQVAVEAEGDQTTRVVDADAEAVREAVAEAADVELETEPETVEPAATETSELEELEDISTAAAAALTAAGIRTARELAEAEPEAVADATDRDLDRARDWVGAARAEFDDLDVAVDDAGASKDEAAEVPADEAADEPGAESEAGGDADAEAEPTGLESIDGIGPTYAERLRDADVTDIEDLAAADADEIAAAAEVGEQRAQDWIDAAGDR